ncbi:MAG TPA: cbb3-type cytochrome c oxidase subunit I [Longimicrobiales bacterium]|nr:cbb3-type cytochrome c oxidase subunit I [Longimicrobiales bacterium]
MFSTVRLFIKTGIGFLVAGLLLGGYILVQRELYGRFADPQLASAHAHAIFVGFVMFMILGVALWLFPRAPKDDTRYQPRIVTASYWLLALSTGARFVAEAGRAWSDYELLPWIVVAGGLGQIMGLLLYFWTMWPRVRSVGSNLREKAGERF